MPREYRIDHPAWDACVPGVNGFRTDDVDPEVEALFAMAAVAGLVDVADNGRRDDSAVRGTAIKLAEANGLRIDKPESRPTNYLIGYARQSAKHPMPPARADRDKALAEVITKYNLDVDATAPAERSDAVRTDTTKAKRRMQRRADKAWERPIGTVSPAVQAEREWDARQEDSDDD